MIFARTCRNGGQMKKTGKCLKCGSGEITNPSPSRFQVKIGIIIVLMMVFASAGLIYSAEYNHQQDVVYGYKDGMALVMDVFSPKEKGNGAGFDFHQWDDATDRFERVTDPEEFRNLLKKSCSITHVSVTTPPILLFHGDEDEVVPIQQSNLLVARLQEFGVEHKLVVAKGKGHGWDEPLENEYTEVLNWFGNYLLGTKKQ
jgi:acetyl esterase/lipase